MKSKLLLLAVVLTTALASTIAFAQDPAPAGNTAPTSDQSAHQMPAGAGIDMVRLCARVDLNRHFYPAHARDHDIEGQAMLECALDSTNHIETCWLLSETPPDESFGQAAMYLSGHIRPTPVHDPSKAFHVDGDAQPHLRFPMTFRLAGAQ
jgi:hypothetical protein